MNLSAVILYHDGDKHYLEKCIYYLPFDCEVVVVETVKGRNRPLIQKTGESNAGGRKIITARYEYSDLHMSDARNQAKMLATRSWVLSIDPDELMHPVYHEYLPAMLEADDVGGFIVNLYSYEPAYIQPNGRVPSIHSQMVRIFRNDNRIIWHGYEDESIEYSLLQHGLTRAQSDISIIHLGYSLTPEEMLKKTQYKLVRQAREERIFSEPARMNELIQTIDNYQYLMQKIKNGGQ